MEEIKKIVIIGTGGHSKVVLSEILQAASYKVLGFIDNFQPQGTIIDKDNNLEVLSSIENINSVIDDDTYGIVAIGSNFLRRKVVNEIEKGQISYINRPPKTKAGKKSRRKKVKKKKKQKDLK